MRAALALLLAVTLAFHLATTPQGHGWGDDFAMYLAHARNLVEGRPYADTGYIYNPLAPRIGPEAYPPVFPLLLTLPVALAGIDVEAAKLMVTGLFMAMLLALWWLARQRLEPLPALLVVAAAAYSPFLWVVRTNVVSEVAFTLFTLLALAWFPWAERRKLPWPAIGLVGGALIALALGTRTVGALLLPAIAAAALWNTRRLDRGTLLALGVGGLALLGQLDMFGDYGRALATGGEDGSAPLDVVSRLPARLMQLAVGVTQAWAMDSAFWGAILSVAICLATALGWLRAVREGPGPAEAFIAGYGAMLLVVPFGADARRIMPLMPLIAMYAAMGLLSLPRPAVRPASLAMVAALAASYFGSYQTLPVRAAVGGVDGDEATGLFRFARSTPVDSVFVFDKARALALYTGRSAAPPHETADHAAFRKWLNEIGADYVVLSPYSPDSLLAFLERENLPVAFRNAHFIVFAFAGAHSAAQAAQP
ncbi:MAG: glycosyltransferase family 39 protein [Alphaproteobacteria bacterium]|nr:glycosyltransferase family 39 protein [Alphaproteobacteria bacterium]